MDVRPLLSRFRLSFANMLAQLVTGLLLLCVIVIALALLSLNQSRHQYEDRATVAAQNLAQLIEQDITASVRMIDLALLTTISEYQARMRAGKVPTGSMNAYLEQHLAWQSNMVRIRISDELGEVRHGAGGVSGMGLNVADRDYFKELRAHPDIGLLISRPIKGRNSEAWVIVFARAIKRPDGSFAGTVQASMLLTQFSKAFSLLSVGSNGSFTVVDDEPRIIVRQPEPAGVKSSPGTKVEFPDLMALVKTQQKTGTFHSRSAVDGIERVYAYRAIANTPFKLTIGLANDDYLVEWRDEAVKTTVLTLAFVLFTGVLSWFNYRAWKGQQVSLDALRQANLTLGAEKNLTSTIVQSSPFAIYTRDKNGIITAWNAAAEKLFGWRAGEIVGKPLLTVPPDKRQETEELRERVLRGESVLQLEVQRVKRDGTRFDLSSTLAPLRNASGDVDGYLAIATDITERKVAEKQIEFLAYRDVLTGLPNRLLLNDRFRQAVAYAERDGKQVALLFLDLDNFKTINDSLGHLVGDAMLKEVATRLGQCVRDTDTISRQGGDEFLVVLPELRGADSITPVLLKIRDQLQLPFELEGHELTTSASIGVAIYPDDGHDFDTLLKKADIAMYQAKESGRNGYRFFDEEMNVEAVAHLRLKNGMRRAIARDEFVLHYQPQIDLGTGAVVGAEALIRWNHPEEGMIAPARFVSLAEESGLIVPIGEWVIREACRQAVAWKAEGLPALVMAVNLSSVQFRRGDVVQTVTQALQDTGFDPLLLELELTESILIQNTDQVLATVKRLKLLGVKLSIDDFGTGYSSLSYLKRFAVDKLKIDQTFIRDLASDPDDAAIIRAIIQMARSLNLKTIAEGVEDAGMLEQLRLYECDEAQGYCIARPMPAPAFAEFLEERSALKLGRDGRWPV